MKKTAKLALALPLALAVAACGPSYSSNSYDGSAVGEVRRVERGTIESYRFVKIENNDSGVGTLAGAGVGAAAGSTVGDGAGGVIGAIGGALIGGLIGNSIEKSASDRRGFEYIILTESGNRVTLVQVDDQPFPAGTPVNILFSGSRSRIIFDPNGAQHTYNDRQDNEPNDSY